MKINKFFPYIFFFPFFVWTFLGGHKQILFGFNSDHIFILLAIIGGVVVLLRTTSLQRIERDVLVLYVLIAIVYFFSIIYANDVKFTVGRAITHLAYYFLVYSLAIFFKDKAELFYCFIISSAFFSSFVVIISWLGLGLGSWGRVTIPVFDFNSSSFSYFPDGYESSSDPNVLAFFLYLGAAVVFFRRSPRGFWLPLVLMIMFSGLLTLSRSALLAFLIAMMLVLMLWCASLLNRRVIAMSRRIIFIYLFVFIPLATSCIYLFFNQLDYLLGLIWGRLEMISVDSDRLYRLAYILDRIGNDVPSLLFGHGADATRQTVDPHNYFLSVVYDIGLFGFFSISLLVLMLVYRILSSPKYYVFISFLSFIFVYFSIAALVYWQVRTYYFLLLIIMVIAFRPSEDLSNMRAAR